MNHKDQLKRHEDTLNIKRNEGTLNIRRHEESSQRILQTGGDIPDRCADLSHPTQEISTGQEELSHLIRTELGWVFRAAWPSYILIYVSTGQLACN